MNNSMKLNQTITSLKMWDYPLFSISLAYVWFELINPIASWYLQVIPKIPNSAICIILSYFFRPKLIKDIIVPFNPLKWALPFLIIATINLPFIDLEQKHSIIELISTWFWVIFLIPIMIRVLATPSGRWHFLIFSTISLLVLSSQYILAMYSFQFSLGEFDLTYHHLAPGVIAIVPIIISYIFIKKGFRRFFLIISLLGIFMTIIPAGSRAIWLIIPLELLLLLIFVLPKTRIIIISIVIGIGFSLFTAVINVDTVYTYETQDFFETRVRKLTEWREDITVWKRLGIIRKTQMILEDHLLLGVGYSNRSFSSFDGGEIDVMGRWAKLRRIDAHNTYFNILGGTGILGFFAFLYFCRKVMIIIRKLDVSIYKRLDMGPYIISVIGTSIWYMLNTHPFSHIIQTAALVMGLYIYQYNIGIMNQTEMD